MNEAEKLINNLYGKGTIGFTCDSCGREINGCNIVNGMKFCAKCYQETFGKDNQQNEIQQLKQQLAEKDKEIERLKEELNENLLTTIDHESHFEIIHEYENEIKELENSQTQLAISELEKVKVRIEKRNNGTRQGHSSVQYKDGYSGCCADIEDQINNQIKNLKGE